MEQTSRMFSPTPPRNESPESSAPSERYVLPETTVMAVIGCIDLLTTVYLIGSGEAREANPLFAQLLWMLGPRAFVAAKALLLAGPLTVAEMARRRNPIFVRAALRIGIILYLGLYAYGF